MAIAAKIGSGVSKVGMALAHPARVAPAELPALAPAGADALFLEFDGGGDGADEPGVDGQPCPAGRLVDARLEVVGQAERDPRPTPLLGVRRSGRNGGANTHRDLRRACHRLLQAAL